LAKRCFEESLTLCRERGDTEGIAESLTELGLVLVEQGEYAAASTACEEGLAPAALAVEPPMRPVFQAMRRPAVMSMLNRLGAASMLGWRSAWLPIRLSPGLCLLVIPSTARSDVLAGGRALQRVWLQATLDGLSLQPYAAAGVLSLGFASIEPDFQRPLSRLKSALSNLSAPGHGLVFLRLGRVRSAPRGRSGRRSLASFGAFH